MLYLDDSVVNLRHNPVVPWNVLWEKERRSHGHTPVFNHGFHVLEFSLIGSCYLEDIENGEAIIANGSMVLLKSRTLHVLIKVSMPGEAER